MLTLLNTTTMRDDAWLSEQMYELWENNFEDVPRLNNVVIKFGKKAKRQLGAIGWLQKKTKKVERLLAQAEDADVAKVSLINITSYFKDENIPKYVVIATIAHEMCHYAHGFNSPLKQMYNHPHKGGIIRKEMQKRGLLKIYKEARAWLKANWSSYVRQY